MNFNFKQLFENLKQELVSLIVIFISFMSPIKGLFIVVGIAVILDTAFGIYRVVRQEGIQGLESDKFFNIAVKTFFYMGSMLLGYTSSVYITGGSLFSIPFFIPKFLCVIWISIEVKSMDETSIKLGNKPILDHIKELIKVFKGFKKDINELNS